MNGDRQIKVNYSIMSVVAAFAVILAIQYLATGRRVQQIPYSQFKEPV